MQMCSEFARSFSGASESGEQTGTPTPDMQIQTHTFLPQLFIGYLL